MPQPNTVFEIDLTSAGNPEASRAYMDITGRPVDLVGRVEARRETTWETCAASLVQRV